MKGLKRNLIITEKKKYGFKLNFEKPINVGKLYFLLNIHKRFSNLLGHPRYFELWYPYRKRFGFLRSSFPASKREEKYSTINIGEI